MPTDNQIAGLLPSATSPPAQTPQTVEGVLANVDESAVPRSIDDLLAKLDAEQSTLPSDRDIDYTPLRDLLKISDWRQADVLTYELMLKAADRSEHGWLDRDALKNFPCTDLRTLDRLWSQYSGGRFGFSAQWSIYSGIEVSGAISKRASYTDRSADRELALQFCKRVEWWTPTLNFLKYYSFLKFAIEAPLGHLPARWFWAVPWWQRFQMGGIGLGRGGCNVTDEPLSMFMTRLGRCGFEAQPSKAVPPPSFVTRREKVSHKSAAKGAGKAPKTTKVPKNNINSGKPPRSPEKP